jgi:hypothetical protein
MIHEACRRMLRSSAHARTEDREWEPRGSAGERQQEKADDAKLEIGAGNEVRTRDLNLGKVALYQLSYSRLNPIAMSFTALFTHRPSHTSPIAAARAFAGGIYGYSTRLARVIIVHLPCQLGRSPRRQGMVHLDPTARLELTLARYPAWHDEKLASPRGLEPLLPP